MRKQTPTGARKMIQVVIRIITTDTDVKKFSSGRPSSPLAAIAIPVTMLSGENYLRSWNLKKSFNSLRPLEEYWSINSST